MSGPIGRGGLMIDSAIASFWQMSSKKDSFLRLVDESKLVTITYHGRLMALAYNVNNAIDAALKAWGFFLKELCPRPNTFEESTVVAFWEDFTSNATELTVHPGTVILLRNNDGRAVLVLQNLVRGAEGVILSKIALETNLGNLTGETVSAEEALLELHIEE